MNKQEIFDKVSRHLIEQGVQASYDDMCRYRMIDTETGQELMCAAGCLIPKDSYLESMENNAIDNLLDVYPNLLGFDLPEGGTELVLDLQHAHDALHAWRPSGIDKSYLLKVAVKHGLNMEVLNT